MHVLDMQLAMESAECGLAFLQTTELLHKRGVSVDRDGALYIERTAGCNTRLG